MSQSAAIGSPTLDPSSPEKWTELPFDALMSLSRAEVAGPQLEALVRRFESLRGGIAALDKLASRQKVDRFDSVEGSLPLFFDHRVYKSYPLSLIDKRDYPRLTNWLNRLTTHDLNAIPLDGVTSIDSWIDRLEEHGMIIGHSTGTTGKLSFIPRSRVEWPAWVEAYFLCQLGSFGVDTRTVEIANISVSGYRSGHQMMTKMTKLFAEVEGGGVDKRNLLYDYPISADVLSLAARLQQAEERGEELEVDPELLKGREQLIEASRHRAEDMVNWYAQQADKFRGQRVRLGGTGADLVRLAVAGREQGIVSEFAPGSILVTGGGMKGYKDAPENWEELIQEFYGIDQISSMYSMSECMGLAPLCSQGYYHFMPFTIPILLDEDAKQLPESGEQTGRMALFDLLAQTYWGGFISGDQITMIWDEDCPCGWKGPRMTRDIQRFAQMEGGDDKITCAGTAKAYNEFMDFVSGE